MNKLLYLIIVQLVSLDKENMLSIKILNNLVFFINNYFFVVFYHYYSFYNKEFIHFFIKHLSIKIFTFL